MSSETSDYPAPQHQRDPKRNVKVSLFHQITRLRKQNFNNEPYIPVQELRRNLSEQVIEAALEEYHPKPLIRIKTKDWYKQVTRASSTRNHKAFYICHKLPITFSILVLHQDHIVVDWFRENNKSDNDLPWLPQELRDEMKDAFLSFDVDNFELSQREFPPIISHDMSLVVWEKYTLPFAVMDMIIAPSGLEGNLYRLTIDPDFDGLHNSGKYGTIPGNV